MADPRLKVLQTLINKARAQGELGVLTGQDLNSPSEDLSQDKAFGEQGTLTEQGVLGQNQPEVPQKSRFEALMNVLDAPGRMTRAGISALQGDGDVLDAIRGQVGVGGPEAPSGFDVASKFGEDYGVENPYVLTAIATAADMLDPTMLIPGGTLGKLAAPVAKIAGKGKDAARALKASENSGFGRFGHVLKDTKPEGLGKVKVLDDAPKPTNWKIGSETVSPVSLPEPKVERSLESLFGREQAEELLSQFPEIGRTIVVPKRLLK